MRRPKPEMGGYNDPDMMRAAERRRREHGECDTTIARLTAERDEGWQEVARLENLMGFHTGAKQLSKGLMLEFARLDGMWRRLVREKGEAEAERDRLRKAIALIRDSGYIRGWWWEEHVAPLIAEAEVKEG